MSVPSSPIRPRHRAAIEPLERRVTARILSNVKVGAKL
jgi:hypothetical protein